MLRSCDWHLKETHFQKYQKVLFKSVLITSKLKSRLSNSGGFFLKKIGYISVSARFPIRSHTNTHTCKFIFLNMQFGWIQIDTNSCTC